MPRQLTIALPVRVALGRADFFVSPSNALAVNMIDRSDTWPNGKLALSGPPGAGKTHLAHVWMARTGARLIAAADLSEDALPELATSPLAIEDVPEIAGNRDLETLLFHLHNLAQANNQPLLFTGRAAPRAWNLTLPDLQSRMEGTAHIALDAPDDALLAAVLGKLFTDRQIVPKDTVIPYLVSHMERSFAQADRIVKALDARALHDHRDITRDLTREVLADLTA